MLLIQIITLIICCNTYSLQANTSNRTQNMLTATLPKVVTIYATLRNPEPNKLANQNENENDFSYGTGFFISHDGVIITSAHVVKNSKTILVNTYDGHETTAELLGIDHNIDIAVLKVPLTNTPFISLDTINSTHIGDTVYAIGNSLGLSHSITRGIISALHRNTDPERIEDNIQTDATIHMGNSGGPLINAQGELIGINNKFRAIAIGNAAGHFAIPTYIAKNISQQLIQYGNTKPSVMGVITQNLNKNLANALNSPVSTGVVVNEVRAGSAADKAQIHVKDIITHIDTKPIHNNNQIQATIYSQRAGNQIEITLYRNGKQHIINATTQSRDETAPTASSNSVFNGITLEQHQSINSHGQMIKGLKVTTIQEGSYAWIAGVLPGDIIEKASNVKLESLKQLAHLEKQATKRPILLEILRDSKRILLAVAAKP